MELIPTNMNYYKIKVKRELKVFSADTPTISTTSGKKSEIFFPMAQFPIKQENYDSHLHNILVTYFNLAYIFCATPFRFVPSNLGKQYVLRTWLPQKVSSA